MLRVVLRRCSTDAREILELVGLAPVTNKMPFGS